MVDTLNQWVGGSNPLGAIFMTKLNQLKTELKKASSPEQAELLQRFFRTAKGEYGEGDIFLGIKVPVQRSIVKQYTLTIPEIQQLLKSRIHEHRMCALFSLIEMYKKANPENKTKIFSFYMKNYKNINNWDLVDLSAPNIAGNYLLDKPKKILYKFAESDNLWKKRIAIVSTYAFIRENQLKDTYNIAMLLLKDKHDLIHKAVGWMLREAGKRDTSALESFIKKHCRTMPRTMLRYAIEKFPEEKRRFYLQK